jgi:hypothetical protein
MQNSGPGRSEKIVVSLKTAAGAIIAVQRKTFKIICFKDMDNRRLRVDTAVVCFKDMDNRRLRVDTAATIGGKHNMSKQGRRVILIYKSHMCNEATLDPERCTHKSDEKPGAHGW